MRRSLAALAAASLVTGVAVIALSQSTLQSRSQQKCLQTLDKNGGVMAKVGGREVSTCLKLATRGSLGNPPTVEACFAQDHKLRVAKTTLKTIAKELKGCIPNPGIPDFAIPEIGGDYTPPADAFTYDSETHRIYTVPVNAAALAAQFSLAGEVFGSNVDAVIGVDAGHLSLCQSQIMKVLQKCEATKRKIYTRCKKIGIKAGTITGNAALADACFAAGDNFTGSAKDQAKMLKTCESKIAKLLATKCSGVALSTAFPGSCAASGNFATCITQRINCRYCQQVNATDQLGRDCDLFDDGTANDSCSEIQGTCGDGDLDPASEQCDDGNNDDGDCCAADCTLDASGSTCGDQNDDECANPGTCDGEGTCNSNDELAGTPCEDDGNQCTADQCDGEGACIHPNRGAGFACGDGSDTDCTNPDTCNGSGSCQSNHESNGTACTSDGNVCTDDVCNGSGSCTHPNNSAPCSDGSFCNGNDTCSAGSCAVHSGDPCPGADGDGNCSESCDEDADNCNAADEEGAACDNGSFCDGTEVCGSGVCGSSSGDPCEGADGDGNCSESCDETNDNCLAPDTNGSSCNDGEFCNGNDSCSAGACTTHAGNPCSGGADCADVCNEVADNCFETAGAVCNDDANPCTDDICNGGGLCVHPNKAPAQPCPDDGLECTNDQCDGAGTCAHPPKVVGSACSTDGNPCTDDICNGGGQCTHPNNSLPCDDGEFCNGNDTCGNGSCSIHAGNPCFGPDGDINCKESCDETNNNCLANDPNGSACNDGLGCNGSDTCQSGTCTPSGVCCGSVDFTFTVNSNSGGVFDSAEWPGGTQQQTSSAGCDVTINNPNDNIDLVCTLAAPFSVNSFNGFANCFGTGGEDGDGCQPVSCPPAGSGSCCSGRPSCSAALNGSGSARYFVHCVDP